MEVDERLFSSNFYYADSIQACEVCNYIDFLCSSFYNPLGSFQKRIKRIVSLLFALKSQKPPSWLAGYGRKKVFLMKTNLELFFSPLLLSLPYCV